MRFPLTISLIALTAAVNVCQAADIQPLRVAADPNNLPFSHQDLSGYENKIAELLASEMGTEVRYIWWGQRRGFIRNTLKATLEEFRADIVIGVPEGYDLVSLTRPYYRSTYVFVSPDRMERPIRSFEDARLKKLKIGVNLIGDDYQNPPPAHELGRRGIVDNVVGYSTFYSEGNEPGRIIEAVASGEIDVAIVWGPLAGFYAKQQSTPLVLYPVPEGESALPFAFNMCLGVRHGEDELKQQLDELLVKKSAEIEAILETYGVPLLPIENNND